MPAFPYPVSSVPVPQAAPGPGRAPGRCRGPTPLSAEQALSELRKFAGIQFDPVVVDAFVKTHYVHDVPDAGRHVQLPPQPIPLIGQAAAHIVAAGRETTAAPVEQA